MQFSEGPAIYTFPRSFECPLWEPFDSHCHHIFFVRPLQLLFFTMITVDKWVVGKLYPLSGPYQTPRKRTLSSGNKLYHRFLLNNTSTSVVNRKRYLLRTYAVIFNVFSFTCLPGHCPPFRSVSFHWNMYSDYTHCVLRTFYMEISL